MAALSATTVERSTRGRNEKCFCRLSIRAAWRLYDEMRVHAVFGSVFAYGICNGIDSVWMTLTVYLRRLKVMTLGKAKERFDSVVGSHFLGGKPSATWIHQGAMKFADLSADGQVNSWRLISIPVHISFPSLRSLILARIRIPFHPTSPVASLPPECAKRAPALPAVRFHSHYSTSMLLR